MLYNLFVYCNPKCGSSTLYNTLINYKYNVYYTHGLDFEKTFLNRDKIVFDIINESSFILKKKI